MNERTKSRVEVVVTSYGRNKNRNEVKKNQEKAKNSPSYHCAANKKKHLSITSLLSTFVELIDLKPYFHASHLNSSQNNLEYKSH